MRHRAARGRAWILGVVGVAALIVIVGVSLARMLSPHPDRVDFDGVTFDGGTPFQRSAVGEFILAVRRNSLAGLMALDDQPDSIAAPDARRNGAKWVLDYYRDKLKGPVRVRFVPPSVSPRELTGCLSFGRDDRLVVLGMRRNDTPSYRIMLGSFPMEPAEAAAYCGDD